MVIGLKRKQEEKFKSTFRQTKMKTQHAKNYGCRKGNMKKKFFSDKWLHKKKKEYKKKKSNFLP